MKQYNSFIFDSYSFDPKTGRIELRYSLDDEVQFTETISVPNTKTQAPNPDLLDRALFALHMIGGISYYKTCCPKKIEVRSGKLTKEQAEFWKTVYENGLGEFFYVNKMRSEGLLNFPVGQEKAPAAAPFDGDEHRVLVPIGGGKDSLVTVELLKDKGLELTLLRVGAHLLIEETAKVAGLPLLNIKRQLSPELFDLNAQGALNGHVPITAYLSFLSIVTALLTGNRAVVFSNERSAEEGNVEVDGQEINHQWSKSLAFEELLQIYVQAYITPDLDIFSLLRPFGELPIAKMFCDLPQYFGCATSCNKNWKILTKKENDGAATHPSAASGNGAATHPSAASGNGAATHPSAASGAWCGACPKCAFSFCLFAAFLPVKDLITIFGKNFFEEDALLPLYSQLLGIEGFKPFECVGTSEETKAAFLLAFQRKELTDTPAMQFFLKECAENIDNPAALVESCSVMHDEHAIPERFFSLL